MACPGSISLLVPDDPKVLGSNPGGCIIIMTKEKLNIWIESKEFENKREFRIKLVDTDPEGKAYETYLGTTARRGRTLYSFEEHVFTAYKKNSRFIRLFGNDFRNQSRIAILKCDKIIKEFKEQSKSPLRTIKYDRS